MDRGVRLETMLVVLVLVWATDAIAADSDAAERAALRVVFKIAFYVFLLGGGLSWVMRVFLRGDAGAQTVPLCDFCDAPRPCPDHEYVPEPEPEVELLGEPTGDILNLADVLHALKTGAETGELRERIRSEFRDRAKRAHPDGGGTTAEFQALQRKYERAIETVEDRTTNAPGQA